MGWGRGHNLFSNLCYTVGQSDSEDQLIQLFSSFCEISEDFLTSCLAEVLYYYQVIVPSSQIAKIAPEIEPRYYLQLQS